MIKSRKALKQEAKALLRVNFTSKMLLFLIPILASIFSIAHNYSQNMNNQATALSASDFPRYLATQLLILTGSLLLSLIIQLFVVAGLFRYIQIFRGEVENPKFSDLFIPFREGHIGKVVLLTFSQYLMIFVLTMTIIGIPFAIYFALGWSQSEKVLFDQIQSGSYQGLGKVLARSAELMRGWRGNYFVFILSFVLWGILDAVTFGIAGFWLQPYFNMSDIAYYQNLLDEEKAQDFQA